MMKEGLQEPLRVGIVSADPLRVVGLQVILAGGDRFEGVPLTAPGALQTPGIELVLDSGATEHLFQLIAEFRSERPNARLLIMGAQSGPEHIERVIAAGARGYLTHRASEEELRLAIEAVHDGSLWAPRRVLARLVDQPRNLEPAIKPAMPKFTQRELEVLKLLVQGFPNREIAHTMGVDEGTIKAHVGRLMRKLGVANRTALTMQALERRLFG
jgi:DNA-binding NarL/FixJ family response regulator